MYFVRLFRHAALLAALIALWPGLHAAAQPAAEPPPSAVTIDTSVLDYLDPSAPQGNTGDPAPYSQPVPPGGFRPTLTAPEGDTQPAPAEAFPVEVKVRTESGNPSLAPTPKKPAPPKTAKKKKSATPKMAAPVPPHKPARAEAAKKTAPAPIPPRRPEVSQVAARATPVIPGGGNKPMPAVPPKPVTMEELPAPPPEDTVITAEKNPLTDELLIQQLITPDRETLAATIDAFGGQEKTAQKEERKEDKPRGPLFREGLAKLVAVPSAPLRKSKGVLMPPSIDKDNAAVQAPPEVLAGMITQPVKQAALPAEPNGPVPRLPPAQDYEREYVSLPFIKGVDKPDAKVAASLLQERILPLMKDNPQWRLQIQAFADPAGAGESSARRLSLARALAVRSWLLDEGIEARRLDVRALGMETDRAPLDRVDLVLFDPTLP